MTFRSLHRPTRKRGVFLALVIAAAPVLAGEPTVGDLALQKLLGPRAITVELWPDKAPDEPRPIGDETVVPSEKKEDALSVHNVTRPSFTLLAPQTAEGPTPAVLICPGGGYGGVGIGNEGAEVVALLNRNGIAGIVLKYRVPKRHQGFPQYHHAVQDGQRALSIIRKRAKEWNIDPRKVGIMGFSAGGNLAAVASTNHAQRLYPKIDAVDDVSCKPDFAVLVYPAYLTDPIDSDNLDPVLHIDALSRGATPPTFIAVAQSDKFARGAVDYFMALRAARVPGELHVYDGGGHGNGLRAQPLGEWGVTCIRWLQALR